MSSESASSLGLAGAMFGSRVDVAVSAGRGSNGANSGDAVVCRGTLRGIDGHTNVALTDAVLPGAAPGETADWAFIVGSNVKFIGTPAAPAS